jgi:uncharacterized protein YdeI (YjbR/CyaY-like superfamily)
MPKQPPAGDEMHPIFFTTPNELIAWLEGHHDQQQELWIGYHKKSTGRPSLTWPETVDAALCFGWIDGIRKSIDAERYKQRLTPRRKRSTWSAINVKRVQELDAAGQVRPVGLAAFAARKEDKTGIYSHEQREQAELGDEFEAELRGNGAAWDFFQAQPASYRKAAIWWIVSARKDETRRKRLATLIADSAAGRTVPPLTWRKAPT